MSIRVAIDPITRAQGSFKVELEIEDDKVIDAFVSGLTFRGFELFLKDRDIRDVGIVTQRICSNCSFSHSLAALEGLEEILNIEIPQNARVVRNLLAGGGFLYSHVSHFYNLSILDYYDIGAVVNYSGVDSSLSRIKQRVNKLITTNDLNLFNPRYESDAFVVRDPETAVRIASNYIEAFDIKRLIYEMMAIFGGRLPHAPSVVLGGVTVIPTAEKIIKFKSRLQKIIDFISDIYLNDTIGLLLEPFKLIHDLKMGYGTGNFMSYGMFKDISGDKRIKRFLPAGAIFDFDLSKGLGFDESNISESTKYSWFNSSSSGHPKLSKTELDYEKDGAYSFIKSPRYNQKPVEVGSLARMLIFKDRNFMDLLSRFGVWPSVGIRHLARAYECKLIAEAMLRWLDQLEIDGPIYQGKSISLSGEGSGFSEAPAGSLGHWFSVENKKIKGYQIISPVTWNASPRDENDKRGPLEEALIGLPVPSINNLSNPLRVIHSFDLCINCAAH